MHRSAFQQYLWESNLQGSGKASSYVRALDLLSAMLTSAPGGFEDCRDIWAVRSVERLDALYDFARDEMRKGPDSAWVLPSIPDSYLRDGYCTAALRSYQRFLVEHSYRERLIQEFETEGLGEDERVQRLTGDLLCSESIMETLYLEEGREAVRSVKTRCNQQIFRKIVLKIYQNTCCLTGLNIPEVNRASHIIPWAERRDTKMDQRNGLCLSATYDAAFDRNLISFDEDYRLILSNKTRDHYTTEIVCAYFHNRIGEKITLPEQFLPKQQYLSEHRSRL